MYLLVIRVKLFISIDIVDIVIMYTNYNLPTKIVCMTLWTDTNVTRIIFVVIGTISGLWQ